MKSPLVVMSAVTGKPNREEIFKYMNGLKNCGIEQVMVYPRAGCELKYLSDEWFCAVENFIDASVKLDMNLWLYDEFNWPSGDAGGVVSEKYPLKAIETKGENKGEIRYRSPLENKKDRFFPDLLNEEATDLFIKCTHEKYFEKFGKYFGSVIKGIFSDEPALGYTATKTSIPYYDEIEEDYKNKFNRSFSDDLKNEYENFLENAIDIISERFNKCFVKKVATWCKEHNVLMTGHLMEDNNPYGGVLQNGNLLKNLSEFSLPGVDEIGTDFFDEREFGLLATAMYSKSENGLMAELFALGPCDITYAKKRCMIYLMSCFKVNYYFLGLSHIDKRGNYIKTLYFNDFSCDQPDFEGTRLLSEDAKKASVLADKDFTPKLYVRYPQKVCAKSLTDKKDIKRYYNLLNELSFAQIPWKLLNENEDSKNIPTVEFTDDFDYVLDGKISDADEIIKRFENLCVTDENGNTPEGIFVRIFDDETYVIINLNETQKTLKKDGKVFKIEGHGVLICEIPYAKKEEKVDLSFDVNYKNNNMMRAMYIGELNKTKVILQEDADLIFAVRNDTDAYIENKKIDVSKKNNDVLFDGIKKLYKTSDKMTIKKGEIVIESKDDIKYLPSVFVIGDFKADFLPDDICRVILNPRKKKCKIGEKISDFGVVEFISTVKIPEGAKSIKLTGTNLYTKIYIDDLLVGEKICSPYVFDIGKEYWNKEVKIKIVQHSSLGPIFGDVKFFEDNLKGNFWRGTPTPEETLFGFDEILFVF